MQAIILAGGLGTRISEESDLKPKPMVEIGGLPIIWHIMSHFALHGVREFIICAGYKGRQIKEFFANYHPLTSDFSVNLATGEMSFLRREAEPWKVTIVDTGQDTQTGGRLRRIGHLLEGDFFMTYGDGLSDIDLTEEAKFHSNHTKMATLAAVKPPGRFATLQIGEASDVTEFREKSSEEIGWINGGFFILSPSVLDLIEGDETIWERGPLEQLSRENELMAFKHSGFWRPMDTLREKRELEEIWRTGHAPWAKPRSL